MKLEKRDLLYRPRRLRKSENLRQLVRENFLHLDEARKMVIVNNARETIIQNHLLLRLHF